MSHQTGKNLAAALAGIIGDSAEKQGISGWLDSGIPELNKALSGSYLHGIPVGRVIEIFGPSSSGKTFLATMMMAAAQKQGGIACFSDHERSFEPVLAKTLGLNVDPAVGNWSYQRPQTFEESVDLAVTFCEQVRGQELIDPAAPLIWVFDSLAAMVPHEKLYDAKGNRRAVGDYNMRDKLALATSCSQSFPGISQFAEDHNMTVLFLNQIRMKPGVMFGDPQTTPGGQAPEFYCSQRISIGKKAITNGETGAKKKQLGFLVKANVVKNKVARPFETAEWQVRFNEGLGVTIDQIATNLDFCVRSGLIPKDGKYCVWEGKKVFQVALEKQLRKDPDALKKLLALIPEEED